jgi:hypothetical protein
MRNRYSSVVYLWDTAWMKDVKLPAKTGNFSLRHRVQTGSGVHPASYPMGTRGSFPGDKAEREADHSPPSNAEVKNMWSYISTLPSRLHVVALS